MSTQEFLSGSLGVAKLVVIGPVFIGVEQIKLEMGSDEEAGFWPDCHQLSVRVRGHAEEQLVRDLLTFLLRKQVC